MVMREHDVMKGVEAALPGEQIVAVALAFPPGTTRAEAGGSLAGGGVGAAAGGVLDGLSSVSSGAGLGDGVGFLMAERRLNRESPTPAYVLALTPSDMYILGKHAVQPLAGNKNLVLVDTIPLKALSVTHRHHGIVTDVTFTDSQTGQSATVECKLLASGIGDFLKALQSDEVPVDAD